MSHGRFPKVNSEEAGKIRAMGEAQKHMRAAAAILREEGIDVTNATLSVLLSALTTEDFQPAAGIEPHREKTRSRLEDAGIFDATDREAARLSLLSEPYESEAEAAFDRPERGPGALLTKDEDYNEPEIGFNLDKDDYESKDDEVTVSAYEQDEKVLPKNERLTKKGYVEKAGQLTQSVEHAEELLANRMTDLKPFTLQEWKAIAYARTQLFIQETLMRNNTRELSLRLNKAIEEACVQYAETMMKEYHPSEPDSVKRMRSAIHKAARWYPHNEIAQKLQDELWEYDDLENPNARSAFSKYDEDDDY
ncbi:MAG: hypothetical protein JWM56_1089 [Candidatus Peribacteria bacterium]|nr:hypothetical protein [Candidatus Peribacteria bacterium]